MTKILFKEPSPRPCDPGRFNWELTVNGVSGKLGNFTPGRAYEMVVKRLLDPAGTPVLSIALRREDA